MLYGGNAEHSKIKYVAILDQKWQVTQKLNLFLGFPPSVKNFWFIARTFKRTSLGLLRFKIDQFVPFAYFRLILRDLKYKKAQIDQF